MLWIEEGELLKPTNKKLSIKWKSGILIMYRKRKDLYIICVQRHR